MKPLRALLLALVVFASVVSATQVSAARKYEGKTMYFYIGIAPKQLEDIAAYIAPKLKDEYGLNISGELAGATAMLEKIVVMRDRPTVSIVGWAEAIGLQACGMGLCAPIDFKQAPNLMNLYPWAINKVNGNVGVLVDDFVAVGLIYNTEAFKNLPPPTSWSDLWRPDLAGRVSITAPESTWGIAFLVMLAKMGGGDENNIEPAFVRIKTLLPNVQAIHTWSSDLAKMMQLGQIWAATTGSNMGPALKAQGFPAAWVAPTDGTPMVNGGVSIVANAPFQDAAHRFLDLYFSPEFQVIRSRNAGLNPTNIRAWSMLSAEEKKAKPVGVTDLYKLRRLDWAAINKNRAAWVERWHKEIQR